MDNGPGYESNPDLPDGVVYCVDCGTIFVFGRNRDCPGCHLDERLNAIEEMLTEEDDG